MKTEIQLPPVAHTYDFIFSRVSQLCRVWDLKVPRMSRATSGRLGMTYGSARRSLKTDSATDGDIVAHDIHLHIPLPDPTASADWFARQVFANYLLFLANNGLSSRVAEIIADALGV